MPAEVDAGVAAASDPKLPGRFEVGSFRNSRSQKLFAINLPRKDASSPPKAMFVLVHGIVEHCCRTGYLSLYESLSEVGVDVYSLDHHGHGRSEGRFRGYTESFDHYVGDVVDYIKQCQKKYTEKDGTCPPLVLFGQSAGGLIAVKVATRLGSYHVGGLLLTSPALGVNMSPEMRVQKFFGPVVKRFLPKSKKSVTSVRPKDMARNPAAVQSYIDDPLCTKGKIVARTALEMMKSFNVVKERMGGITCPLLILHGTDDRCASINASKDFFRHVGTPATNKRFLELQGMYHELLEEPETDLLMVSIVGFASNGGKQFADVEGEENEGVINLKLM